MDDPSVSKRNRRRYPPSLIFPFNSILSLFHFSARGKKQTGIYADFRVGRNKRETRNIELLETKAEFFHIFESIRGDIGANRRDYFWFGSVMMIGGALKYCFNIGVCTTRSVGGVASSGWRKIIICV